MHFRFWPLRLLTLLALSLLALGTARADDYASDWASTDQGAARLVVAPGNDGALRLGLAFRLQPHWKIYWRSPGDAGLPPEVDWTGSENATVGDFAWPVPERFELSGLETFGYEGEVVLPAAVVVPKPGEPAHLKAAVNFLTCSELCVPNNVSLDLTVPPGLKGPGPYGELLDRFQARVPGDGSASGLIVQTASVGGAGKAARLDLTLRATPALVQPDVIVENAAPVVFGRPTMAAGGLETHLVLPALDGAASIAKLAGKPLTLTIIDRSAPDDRPRAATVTVAAVPLVEGGGAADLVLIMAIAVLGGLILNFMPCVLPVLSIKLLALVAEAGHGRGRQRASFLATAAGILTSFLVMAAALIAAKSAGLSVGWGVQFQEPVFLAALAALVTLFACNLMGWFEIQLPWWLAGRLQAGGGGSLAGSFLSGAFATLLATPCSAPFLGTAVGFALAGGPGDILLIFACLGIGLALPYFVVAAFPGLARVLPRPGAWMVTLRRVLGLLLAGTAVWLVWILAEQAGTVAAGAVALLGLAASAALAFGRRLRGLLPVAALLLLAMLAPPALITGTGHAAALGAGWSRFDPAAIDPAVAKGRVVFVDVTATWCLTCQVNERLVLDKPEVKARLGARDVVAMRADWTRPDPAIDAFLKRYGRYGIPFNVVYGPGAPDGLPLSEVLTTDAVEAALAKAGAHPGGTGS